MLYDFLCIHICIIILLSYRSVIMSSTHAECHRILMQNNYADAAYVQHRNSLRRSQYRQEQQLQRELSGTKQFVIVKFHDRY